MVITAQIAAAPLDAALAVRLNAEHGANGELHRELFDACKIGGAEGWLCEQAMGGVRFGRAFQPTGATHGFSADIVEMGDLIGPHHVHPTGEIDLIMPLTDGATFDGHPAGWCVYEAGTAHRATVANGKALLLYLLPQGEIEFTGQ